MCFRCDLISITNNLIALTIWETQISKQKISVIVEQMWMKKKANLRKAIGSRCFPSSFSFDRNGCDRTCRRPLQRFPAVEQVRWSPYVSFKIITVEVQNKRTSFPTPTKKSFLVIPSVSWWCATSTGRTFNSVLFYKVKFEVDDLWSFHCIWQKCLSHISWKKNYQILIFMKGKQKALINITLN